MRSNSVSAIDANVHTCGGGIPVHNGEIGLIDRPGRAVGIAMAVVMAALTLAPAAAHATASAATATANAGGTFLVGTAKVPISPTFPYSDGNIYVGGVIP